MGGLSRQTAQGRRRAGVFPSSGVNASSFNYLHGCAKGAVEGTNPFRLPRKHSELVGLTCGTAAFTYGSMSGSRLQRFAADRRIRLIGNPINFQSTVIHDWLLKLHIGRLLWTPILDYEMKTYGLCDRWFLNRRY